MRTKKFILILAFGLLSVTIKAQVTDQIKYKMFCTALDNYSTSPNYIVVTVKNIKTDQIKEICTEAPFLQGAVGQETGNWQISCIDYKNRHFEFAQDSALWNISFDLYSKTELDRFARTIDINKTVQQIKNGRLTNRIFKGNRKEQIMYAHLMFNNGVLMTRGCIAGNICGLTYFKSN